mmetsp:Transcript_14526/g.21912  ORF Transcript_14526/g.21912 Transcript_14526/m.21912 type:complete len:189 (-) Transcript_14526:110-676(-)
MTEEVKHGVENYVDATFATAIAAIRASIIALEVNKDVVANSTKLRTKLSNLHAASCELAQLLTLEDDEEELVYEKIQVPEVQLQELRIRVVDYAQSLSSPQQQGKDQKFFKDSDDDDIQIEDLALSQEELHLLKVNDSTSKTNTPPTLTTEQKLTTEDDDDDDDDLIVEEIELSPEELAQLGISPLPS